MHNKNRTVKAEANIYIVGITIPLKSMKRNNTGNELQFLLTRRSQYSSECKLTLIAITSPLLYSIPHCNSKYRSMSPTG